MVLAFVVVFYLGMKRRVVDGWGRGGGTSKAGSANVEIGQMRKG